MQFEVVPARMALVNIDIQHVFVEIAVDGRLVTKRIELLTDGSEQEITSTWNVRTSTGA